MKVVIESCRPYPPQATEDDVANGEFSPKALSPPLIPNPSMAEISPEPAEEATGLAKAPTIVSTSTISLHAPPSIAAKEGAFEERKEVSSFVIGASFDFDAGTPSQLEEPPRWVLLKC